MMNYMMNNWGLSGFGAYFWITTLLIWGALILLIAYLWKLINRK